MNKSRLTEFVIPKLKYGASSAVATSVDYLVFFLIVHFTSVSYATLAQVFAYACGLLTNFFLQKRFVFALNRNVYTTFQLSLSFSLLGLFVSSSLIYLLSQTAFFKEYLILAKILVTGVMFLYNFYSKRFAFERRKVFNKPVKTEQDQSSK